MRHGTAPPPCQADLSVQVQSRVPREREFTMKDKEKRNVRKSFWSQVAFQSPSSLFLQPIFFKCLSKSPRGLGGPVGLETVTFLPSSPALRPPVCQAAPRPYLAPTCPGAFAPVALTPGQLFPQMSPWPTASFPKTCHFSGGPSLTTTSEIPTPSSTQCVMSPVPAPRFLFHLYCTLGGYCYLTTSLARMGIFDTLTL